METGAVQRAVQTLSCNLKCAAVQCSDSKAHGSTGQHSVRWRTGVTNCFIVMRVVVIRVLSGADGCLYMQEAV